MADELDPIQELATAHTKRMQEISDESFEKSKELCDDVVSTVRRHAGLKSDLLDKALATLGIDDNT